ncbi:MAG TPA: substrate-binding domain-containing protein [Candidatus Acidoferrum sp.]|nr:substrate-binding domain-containing protein [Candidatus Acidoferrum sp.]
MTRFRCKRVLAVASAAILITGSLAGCSSPPSRFGARSHKGYRLAGVSVYVQDPAWATLQCGAVKQARLMGAKMTWFSTATDTSSATQQMNFNAALLTKPDALILVSWLPGTFSTQVKTLMQQGVPVIGVNSTITPPTERVLFVNSRDNSDFVNYIAKHLKGETGSLGVLGGMAGVADAVLRWKPVTDELRIVAPNLKILPTQFDDFNRTKASIATSAMIVANPDLKVIYSITGPEGEGAAAAIKQAGKAGQIKLYSYGANEAEVAALKSGVVQALYGQPMYGLGQEGVKAAIDYLKIAKKGQPVPQLDPVMVNVPLKVLTKENIDDPSSAPYLQKSTCE